MTGTDVLNHMDQLENWPIAACQHLEMGEVMCVCRNGNFCNRNFLTKVPADFQTQLPTALDVEVSQGIPLMETITEKPKNQTWAERFEYKTEPNMTGNDKNISSPPYFWIPLARSTTSSFDDANLDDYEDVEETSSIIATPINEGENLSPDISIFVITALAKIYYT